MINCDGLYNRENYEKVDGVNYFSDRKLHFRIIENGTILPHKQLPDTVGFGGIVDGRGNFIEESFIHPEAGHAYTPAEKIEQSPLTVIYLGMLVQIWGHCLTDNIKRVWFLKSDVYKKYFKNYPIVYVPMWAGIIPPFAKLLEILEVDVKNLYPIFKPTQFQNIVLPDESFFPEMGGGTAKLCTQEYIDTVEQIRSFALKNYAPLSQKNFYFFHGRNQIGEERIAEYFKSKNYDVIRPEVLPLEEQLNILANCENFASSLGSVAHNTLFVKDNSNALFFPRVPLEKNLNDYQNTINQIRNLNVAYVDISLSIFATGGNGTYCYIINEQLKKFFGDDWSGEYAEEDFITFLNYTCYAIAHGIKVNSEYSGYYSKIFPDFIGQLKQRKDLMEKFGVNIN